jgi:hypothetical protein
MGASCNARDGEWRDFEAVGLMPNHAYSVLEVRRLANAVHCTLSASCTAFSLSLSLSLSFSLSLSLSPLIGVSCPPTGGAN